MTIELVPLCTVDVRLRDGMFLPGTPSGTRIIGEVESARAEGERLKATMKGTAAADWLVVAPDGLTGMVDVRLTLETDDGALIYAQYTGRILLDNLTVYVAPRFETGDERYAWLNRIQAVGKGHFPEPPHHLRYEWYEVR